MKAGASIKERLLKALDEAERAEREQLLESADPLRKLTALEMNAQKPPPPDAHLRVALQEIECDFLVRNGLVIEVRATKRARIEMPPGLQMNALANMLFSKKTAQCVFEPIVADYQHEMFEAIKAGHPQATVRRIQTRHWIGFVVAVACQIVESIGKIVRAWKGAG